MLAWLDDRIKIAKGTSSIPTWSAGDYKASAQTADHSDGAGGMWLICDGTAIPSQWATLVGLVGANRPDARGRTIVMKGTHTDVNALLDSDGAAVGNRTPVHNTSPGTFATTLGITGGPYVNQPTGVAVAASGASYAVGTTSGSPSLTGSNNVGGAGGPGGSRPTDTPAYLVIGNLFIHT